MLSINVSNLLEQAKQNEGNGNGTIFNYTATIFTPTKTIQLISVDDLEINATMLDPGSHHELIVLNGKIQPGVYYNDILPYKDKLELELIEGQGLQQTAKRYKCVPLDVMEIAKQSNSTHTVNLGGMDTLGFFNVNFQLIDPCYDAMKSLPVGDIYYLCKMGDAVHFTVGSACKKIPEEYMSTYNGIKMELPIDNEKVYKHVLIPQNVDLVHFIPYLQDRYGIYSNGAGSYYRDGYWYIYSLWNSTKYDTSDNKLDIFKIPEDVAPTLESTFFVNGGQTTIVSTGQTTVINTSDVDRQNVGTGSQIISGDAVAGITGSHYNKGRAIISRADTLTEYRTSERGTGTINDKVMLNPIPTSNVLREISNNRAQDGELMTVPWQNADPSLLFPGMAVKYFYMDADTSLLSRTGTLVGYSWGVYANQNKTNNSFRKHASLVVFLGLDETVEE